MFILNSLVKLLRIGITSLTEMRILTSTLSWILYFPISLLAYLKVPKLCPDMFFGGLLKGSRSSASPPMCLLSSAAKDAHRTHCALVSAGPAESTLGDTGDAVAIGTHPPKHQQIPLATEVLTFLSSSFFF